ncbi:MAG: NADH-quinone oxidoreductase subunit L [Thermoprotei archaeon]
MSELEILVWAIPLLPIALSFIPILFGGRLPKGGGHVAIASVGASAILSGIVILRLPSTPADYSVTWLLTGSSVPLRVGFYLDHLSALMVNITAWIALLILVYSLEYMGHEEGLGRYWTEMMLFTGSMMGFALADSILLMYVFWELIGACSYLLIGFWYTLPEAAAAAKKAFVVVRVGDIGFFAGFILIYLYGHTLSLQALLTQPTATIVSPTLRTTIAILIFVGAIGKSAQLPLYTWLPDAMEGPTTVSALIHSATMVAAGVYLVARLYPFFLAAPHALTAVAWVGALSAFLAATMGLVSTDLKRILAYSTMSQLGYMMTALGVGAYGAAMFHLLNHAIFKALLFLSAGAVLHVLGTRDIRQMGGLLRQMKVTSIAFLVGALSLSGIPPFNGFFSKDLILGAAYEYGATTGDYYIYALTLVSVIFTAAYIFRAFFVGYVLPPSQPREKPVHEVPAVMTIPMIILMVLTLITGWAWSPITDIFQKFVIYTPIIPPTPTAPVLLTGVSISFAIVGFALAYTGYLRLWFDPSRLRQGPIGARLHRLISNGYYFDAAYAAVARALSQGVSLALDFFDRRLIDGAVNGVGYGLTLLGRRVRTIETGRVRNYLALIIIGIVVIIVLVEAL